MSADPSSERGAAFGEKVPPIQRRATSLSPQDMLLLNQWGDSLCAAFGEIPYLVGSVARAEATWRDVDVRLMLDAAAFQALTAFDSEGGDKLAALNLAFTLWGRLVTGLPIDFQFQSVEEWREHDGEPRNPLGVRTAVGWA